MPRSRQRQQRVEVDARHFVQGFASSLPVIAAGAEAFVSNVGEFMARESQGMVPVDQSDLKNSMETKSARTRLSKTGRGGNYYYEVRYTDDAAVPQEYGSTHHEAQPFLRPAQRRAAQRLGR